MEISKHKMVSVSYTLTYDNATGEIIEKTDASNPLKFVFGTGNMLEHFEKNIEGLKTGDKFSFSLTSEQAYGGVEAEAIIDLPISIFEQDGKVDDKLLAIGNAVPMMDNSGNRLTGIVRSVNDKFVSMDFNHPLAGQDLHFAGEVINVREANEDEIEEAVNPGGCSTDSCGTCGCGCH